MKALALAFLLVIAATSAYAAGQCEITVTLNPKTPNAVIDIPYNDVKNSSFDVGNTTYKDVNVVVSHCQDIKFKVNNDQTASSNFWNGWSNK